MAAIVDAKVRTRIPDNPQEYLSASLNARMMVDYSAFCALNGMQLEKLKIVTEDDIDLRGFLRLDPEVSSGYDDLRYTVRIKGDGGLWVREWGGGARKAVCVTRGEWQPSPLSS